MQLTIRFSKLSIRRTKNFTLPHVIFFIGQMRIGQLDIIAILRRGGFRILFRGVQLFHFIDRPLFGSIRFDLIINFLIEFDGNVGQTSCYAPQPFSFGIEDKAFIVGRWSTLFLGFKLELFIIHHANLIIKIALRALAGTLPALDRSRWHLEPVLQTPWATQDLHLDFLYWFCCHYYLLI